MACLDELINTLGLNNNIVKVLNNNNILTIKDLWNLDRDKLKQFGFNDNDIKHIIIHLQLKGIDLNKKKY